MAQFQPIEPYETGLLDVGDGQQIYWECCGNPAGKPALFLHGGPGTGCSVGQRRFFDPDVYSKRRSRPIRKGLAWGLQSVDQRVCKSLAGGMEAATTENYEVRPNDQGRSSSIRDCG
ncbi:hypothetical protein ACVME8_006874 [Bradyrhizobium diazoefficiens]